MGLVINPKPLQFERRLGTLQDPSECCDFLCRSAELFLSQLFVLRLSQVFVLSLLYPGCHFLNYSGLYSNPQPDRAREVCVLGDVLEALDQGLELTCLELISSSPVISFLIQPATSLLPPPFLFIGYQLNRTLLMFLLPLNLQSLGRCHPFTWL